jgi:hypothetical protein
MKQGLLFFLLSISFCSAGQTERTVINKSIAKAQQIKTCSYTIYKATKLSGMRDTAYETGSVSFQNVVGDTLMGMWLKIDNYKGITDIYNGVDFIKIRRADSAVYLWKASEFTNLKQSILSDKLFFSPFIKTSSFLTEIISDTLGSLKFANDTLIENEPVKVIMYTVNQQSKGQKPTQLNMSLFFRKSDFLLMGYSRQIAFLTDKKLLKFEKSILENIFINQKSDVELYSFKNIPPNFSIKQQTTQSIKNFIVIADAIENLNPEIFTQTKSYHNIENRNLLVLLINDTASIPCKKSLALLDSIYPEIENEVMVIVISKTIINDDYDFLKKQQKDFPEFFTGGKILNEIKINVYPTFYVLDKGLKILYKSEGFNLQLKQQLINQIDQLN